VKRVPIKSKRTGKPRLSKVHTPAELAYYERKRAVGRPAWFDNGPEIIRARFDELLKASPKRVIGRWLVYTPVGERPFIVVTRAAGRARRFGSLEQCEICGDEFFKRDGKQFERVTTCSAKCSGRRGRSTKRRQSVARGGPKKDSLDRWFSMIVRSVGVCASCGTSERLQCAHVVSRRYLGVRYSIDNAMCLCAACHLRYTHRPLEWEQFVISRMGEPALLDIKRRALAFRGPFDRAVIALALYSLAEQRGLKAGDLPGWVGWTGLHDPDAETHRAEYSRNRRATATARRREGVAS
jgi:5-methylcytosine-specific restriction endonuclease McrA